jgi:glycosyltransferase involved in cell wall biosynthesis
VGSPSSSTTGYWAFDDETSAATTLVQLIEDEPKRAAMARAAASRFRRCFDVEVVVPKLVAFLQEVADGC